MGQHLFGFSQKALHGICQGDEQPAQQHTDKFKTEEMRSGFRFEKRRT